LFELAFYSCCTWLFDVPLELAFSLLLLELPFRFFGISFSLWLELAFAVVGIGLSLLLELAFCCHWN
jgi:hypothetical protein